METFTEDKIKNKSKTNLNLNTSRSNKFLNEYLKYFSTEISKTYLLPPLKRNIYKKSLMKQSSVLSNYIENFVSNFIKKTKKLKKFSSHSKLKITPKRNSIEMKTKSTNNEIIKEDESIKRNSLSNNIMFLSQKEKFDILKKRSSKNIDNKLLYITDITNGISPKRSFSKKQNTIRVNKNLIPKDSATNIKLIIPSGKETNLPKSINIDRELTLGDLKRLKKFFRRKKTYQPKILVNWKEKIGLDVKIIKKKYISEVENEIEYQSKILTDQMKLLEGNIKYFNKNIISNPNFDNSFNTLVLKSKINFNKALEETIGIIYLLPRLILSDFYLLINKFHSIRIPNSNKFDDKYVFDEYDNLKYNCDLLKEVFEFFNNCFEVYLILINEVDDMNINFKKLSNILSAFEKARYNMIYVINSSTNAIKFYEKDMDFINNFDHKLGIKKPMSPKKPLSDKIMEQFNFKKNPDRQKKLMIDSCLSERKKDESDKREINFSSYFKKKIKTPKFKSLVNTKLVKSLLKNIDDETKNMIKSEIVNEQMAGNFSDDDELFSNKRKVIKIHF